MKAGFFDPGVNSGGSGSVLFSGIQDGSIEAVKPQHITRDFFKRCKNTTLILRQNRYRPA